jgi:hypothetical protein
MGAGEARVLNPSSHAPSRGDEVLLTGQIQGRTGLRTGVASSAAGCRSRSAGEGVCPPPSTLECAWGLPANPRPAESVVPRCLLLRGIGRTSSDATGRLRTWRGPGFSSFTHEDGTPGIRVITEAPPVTRAKSEKWAQQFHQFVMDAGNDTGLPAVSTTIRPMSKSETPKELHSVLPSGARVTFEGHREVPESEQEWEIHLRPKHSPASQTQSNDTQVQPKD